LEENIIETIGQGRSVALCNYGQSSEFRNEYLFSPTPSDGETSSLFRKCVLKALETKQEEEEKHLRVIVTALHSEGALDVLVKKPCIVKISRGKSENTYFHAFHTAINMTTVLILLLSLL
jgi:hypothetical protein